MPIGIVNACLSYLHEYAWREAQDGNVCQLCTIIHEQTIAKSRQAAGNQSLRAAMTLTHMTEFEH
jgi:hypothetical protein